MKVLITGGGGFIGTRLAHRLVRTAELTGPDGTPQAIDTITLLDIDYSDLLRPPDDPRVQRITGPATDGDLLRSLVDRDDVAVFHLASMVSAACETDFDAALRVNVGSVHAVLQAARARGSRPRVVFASSVATFGGEAVTSTVTDTTKLTPETTYGTTKAIGELLVNDYTRKGFVDGRSARLPTVVIRPGRPNAAASSWVSGIFREPLNGQQAVVPVARDLLVPISGYRTVVENLIRLYEAPDAAFGPDRAVSLPSLAVTADDMAQALVAAAGGRRLGPIVHRPDPLVQRIFAGWARTMSSERAADLALTVDDDLESIIRGYIEDFLG